MESNFRTDQFQLQPVDYSQVGQNLAKLGMFIGTAVDRYRKEKHSKDVAGLYEMASGDLGFDMDAFAASASNRGIKLTKEDMQEAQAAQWKDEQMRQQRRQIEDIDRYRNDALEQQRVSDQRLADYRDESLKLQREVEGAKLETDLLKMQVSFGQDQNKLEAESRNYYNNNQAIKDFHKVKSAYGVVAAMRDQESAAGDLGMIFSFMKALDPTSVVREGEQRLAMGATSAYGKLENYIKKLQSGEQLNPKQRDEMLNAAKALYEMQSEVTKGTAGTYWEHARRSGLPAFSVVPQDDATAFGFYNPSKEMEKGIRTGGTTIGAGTNFGITVDDDWGSSADNPAPLPHSMDQVRPNMIYQTDYKGRLEKGRIIQNEDGVPVFQPIDPITGEFGARIIHIKP